MSNETQELYFNVDVPSFLKEVIEGHPKGGHLVAPMNILIGKMRKLAARAIELDDPELNIIMLEMKLYEVPHNQIHQHIDNQRYKAERAIDVWSEEEVAKWSDEALLGVDEYLNRYNSAYKHRPTVVAEKKRRGL